MKTIHILTILLAAFSFTNCTDKPHEKEKIDIEANLEGIEKTRQIFMKAVKEGDGAIVGKMVTADAKTISPGSDDWREMYVQSKNQGPFPYDSIFMFPEETVIASDSVAYDYGLSHVYYTDSLGNVVELKDRFLAILKKGKDGVWRLHREVASSNVSQ